MIFMNWLKCGPYMYAKLFEDRIFVMILIVILFMQLYKIDSFVTTYVSLIQGAKIILSRCEQSDRRFLDVRSILKQFINEIDLIPLCKQFNYTKIVWNSFLYLILNQQIKTIHLRCTFYPFCNDLKWFKCLKICC